MRIWGLSSSLHEELLLLLDVLLDDCLLVQPSQRIRPSRVASARKASLKEASSASEEAGDDEDEIENDEDDEDFTI